MDVNIAESEQLNNKASIFIISCLNCASLSREHEDNK